VLTTTLGFDIWAIDVNQAYFRAAVDLQRKIVTKPDVLNLGEDELLQVMKPLYGLSDSDDYWAETLSAHHFEDLRTTQATADFSLFFKSLGGKLFGTSGAHVDDILQIGTPELRRQTITNLGAAFDVKTPENLPFTFTGLKISRNDDGSIAAEQGNYVATLYQLPLTTSCDAFRSRRQNLAWVCHTRPDIACAVSFTQQITEKKYGPDAIKLFNRVILHLRKTPDVTLRFPALDSHTLSVVAYADVSFHNFDDDSSQLGYVIVLSDDSDTCAIVHFSSHKSKRVTR
jgi:hypothetical protein